MTKNILLLFTYITFILTAALFSFYIIVSDEWIDDTKEPAAKAGVFDLSNFDFQSHKFVKIEGESEFYWKQLLTPIDFRTSEELKPSSLLNVHGVWNNQLIDSQTIDGVGYATYRLNIKLPKDDKYSIRIKEFDCAYLLFINGELFVENGHVGKSIETSTPCWKRRIVTFTSDTCQAELILQVSNFRHRKGGPEDAMLIGLPQSINDYTHKQINLSYFLFGIFIIGFFYHLVLYIFRPADKSILLFSVFNLMVTLRLITVGEKIIYEIFPNIPWLFAVRLEYLSFMLAVPLFYWFIYAFFPALVSKSIGWVLSGLTAFVSLIILFFPASIFTYTPLFFQVVIAIIAIYLLYVLLKAVYNKYEHAVILFGGYSFFFIIVINDILYYNKIHGVTFAMPLGLFILTFSQAFVLARKTSLAFSEVEKLSLKLDKSNSELETKVDKRTQEVILQKDEIELQKTKLELQAENLKLANEKLVDLDKFKDGLTSMIVHDLKNPLNVILNLSTDSMVIYSANRMLNLAQNMLDIQKYEDANMELIKEKVLFKDIVSKALSQVNVIMETKEIKLLNSITTNIKIDTEEGVMIRVLVNLLSNAIKFTSAKGQITLRYEALHSTFKFYISDTGIGIPKDKHDVIFLKYGQIISKKLEKHDSTGLGLAFCKLAIEAHEGIIGFDSVEGKGTTFWFEIPCLNCKVVDTIEAEYASLIKEKSIDALIPQLGELIKKSDIDYMESRIALLAQSQIYEVSSLKIIIKEIDINFSPVVFIWVKKMLEVIDRIEEVNFYKLLSVFSKSN